MLYWTSSTCILVSTLLYTLFLQSTGLFLLLKAPRPIPGRVVHAHTCTCVCVHVYVWQRRVGFDPEVEFQVWKVFLAIRRLPLLKIYDMVHTCQELSFQCPKNLGLQHSDFLDKNDVSKSSSFFWGFVLRNIIAVTLPWPEQGEFEENWWCPLHSVTYVYGWFSCVWFPFSFQLFCIFWMFYSVRTLFSYMYLLGVRSSTRMENLTNSGLSK